MAGIQVNRVKLTGTPWRVKPFHGDRRATEPRRNAESKPSTNPGRRSGDQVILTGNHPKTNPGRRFTDEEFPILTREQANAIRYKGQLSDNSTLPFNPEKGIFGSHLA